jgi:hypothetical protein
LRITEILTDGKKPSKQAQPRSRPKREVSAAPSEPAAGEDAAPRSSTKQAQKGKPKAKSAARATKNKKK